MIYDFNYYAPTNVIFGKGVHLKVGDELVKENAKKVLVHYGSSHAKRSGLLSEVEEELKKKNIEFVELGGVVPNPRLSLVNKGIELCKKEGVDFILAVGGGSVIDSAKAIGYGLVDSENGNVWDFYDGIRFPLACAPIGVILTIAATGSEMSNSSVITNEDGWFKKSCNTNLARPRFALMNPELTYSLPDYQTMCGSVDIMMHTIERYFVEDAGSMLLTDLLAESVLKTVKTCALTLKNDPNNYDARAMIMWASSISHNGLTGCGNSAPGDWACHRIEHELGGLFDVAHGAGLSAIWTSWAKFVVNKDPARFVNLGEKVFGITALGSEVKDALVAIDAIGDFFKQINMPTNLRELGITLTEDQIELLAFKCTNADKITVGNFIPLGSKEVAEILRKANSVSFNND